MYTSTHKCIFKQDLFTFVHKLKKYLVFANCLSPLEITSLFQIVNYSSNEFST